MMRYFEYCRFTSAPHAQLRAPDAVKHRFDARATDSGGRLFGCWRSLAGLGLARDEGIALTAWPDIESARSSPQVDGGEHQVLAASVRPTSNAPPSFDGVYVFRWFHLAADDWETFRGLSDAAWPNMEATFDVNICGFWRCLDTRPPRARVLLLTRYADLSVWEASRWWNKPVAAADESMSKFRARNDLIQSTVAYPLLRI